MHARTSPGTPLCWCPARRGGRAGALQAWDCCLAKRCCTQAPRAGQRLALDFAVLGAAGQGFRNSRGNAVPQMLGLQMWNENPSGSVQPWPHGLRLSCECSHLCWGAVVEFYPNSFAKKCVKKSPNTSQSSQIPFYLFSEIEINCSFLVAIHRPWDVMLSATSGESSMPTQGWEN